MISEIIIPEKIRKEIFNEGLILGTEYKAEGRGPDDWPGIPPLFIRKHAVNIFYKSKLNNIPLTEIYEMDIFDEIENELEEIFNNGYHQAFTKQK